MSHEPERAYAYDAAVADRIKERILQSLGERVMRIILFGSRARGDAFPDSDYDVLIVLRDLTTEGIYPELVKLYKVVAGSGAVVEPHVMSADEFDETRDVIGGLAYPAAHDGKVLYTRD